MTHARPRPTSPRGLRALPAIIAASLLIGGCATNPRDLPLVEKARLLKKLRAEAEDCLARFQRSNGVALEELECYTEKQRRTTDLYPPADCPHCYQNYGYGLFVEGNYYLTLAAKLRQEMERSRQDESRLMEAKALEADAKARALHARALENFQAFFASGGPGPGPYLWASDSAAVLEDYDKALRFLESYERTVGRELPDKARKELERIRRRYERLYQKQQLARDGGDPASR